MSDAPHRLVCMEIWRPLRYIGSRGPRCFWRECLPIHVPDGWYMNDAGERVHRPAHVVWGKPTEWRVMSVETARRYLSLGEFIVDDAHPGVTFAVRRFKGAGIEDWRQAQGLRELAVIRPGD